MLDDGGSFSDALLNAPEIDDRFDAALDALLAPEAYTGLAAAFVRPGAGRRGVSSR